MIELVHVGKRVAWLLNRPYPTLDGASIDLRVFKPLIAAGLVARTRELWHDQVLLGHEWGPTPRAVEHFSPAATTSP